MKVVPISRMAEKGAGGILEPTDPTLTGTATRPPLISERGIGLDSSVTVEAPKLAAPGCKNDMVL